jgi:hypothetical protein
MATVTVTKPFTLMSDDGKQRRFVVGTHEVDDAIADHWYVKAHSADAEPVVAPGHPAYTEAARQQMADAVATEGEAELPEDASEHWPGAMPQGQPLGDGYVGHVTPQPSTNGPLFAPATAVMPPDVMPMRRRRRGRPPALPVPVEPAIGPDLPGAPEEPPPPPPQAA